MGRLEKRKGNRKANGASREKMITRAYDCGAGLVIASNCEVTWVRRPKSCNRR
jgi:hypothetical protein